MATTENFKPATVEEAIEDFREGKFVIVVDDPDRENEGDLITAAELITEDKVNFMLSNGRGVLCAPITISRCNELKLPHHAVHSNGRQTRRLHHRSKRTRPRRNDKGTCRP